MRRDHILNEKGAGYTDAPVMRPCIDDQPLMPADSMIASVTLRWKIR